MLYIGTLARAETGTAKICPFLPKIPGTEHPRGLWQWQRGRAVNPPCSAFSRTEMDFNLLCRAAADSG